ncbi:hypothetical protein [Streptomyces acidicola]|uniref:Uncharacterized protein n=1 Tax=Streptomyces acidicola TaxID=2596892 RepID=A0A5N8WNJ9_9ACTN|nr:hypothetical protein [Streptomyces acidicola]MPY48114.1 hypothetical protein [Streptomyces acidicola]
MAAIALYYPWMHFQDSDWLKLALLSWERIVRLRPRAVDDRDNELVREIRGESDLLHEITPSEDDLDTVATAFFELLSGEETAVAYTTRALMAMRAEDPALVVSADDGGPSCPLRTASGHLMILFTIGHWYGSTAAAPTPRCPTNCGTIWSRQAWPARFTSRTRGSGCTRSWAPST